MDKFWLFAVLLVALSPLLAACGEDLGPRVTELEGQVASLQSQVQSLQNEKAQLEARNAQLEGINAQLAELVGPPPASLDALYPPQAPAPLYVLQMFAMDEPLVGVFADFLQGDMENAMANWETFKQEYQKAAQMVPEWSDRFPMEPLAAIDVALQTGDPGQVMGAMEGLWMQVCGSCHLANVQKVRAKYHWPDFAKITLTDPVTQQKLPWMEFKAFMGLAFSGIGNDLKQGQLDNALQNFQGFSAKFNTLRQACGNCHATERYYFVDQRVLDDIEALGNALQATPPDPEAIGGLMQKIGEESCGGCHLVHQPAEQLKHLWEFMAEQQ